MSVKVKICGITHLDDALAAVEAGADALGFLFQQASARFIAPAAAAKIIRNLPPFIAKVGVFVDAPVDAVRRIASECWLDTVQLHGEESPEFCRQFAPMKVIKAFRIRDEKSLAPLSQFDTDAWLLDSFVPGKEGGTGATFNWDLANQAKESGRPVILAGGLTAENVAQAIHEVWPYAVDVSSGVEASPGRKDHGELRRFIATVRATEQERF